MDREANQWEYKIKEHEGTEKEKEYTLRGRTISQLDMPEMFRRAGVVANDHAFTRIVTEFPDVLVDVSLSRCVLSHKIGYEVGCDFRPTDFSNDEVRELMLRIMKPFKVNLVRESLKVGEGTILDVLTEDEIEYGKENGWFTPEEEAAIDAEIFLAKEHKQGTRPARKTDAQTTS